MATIKSLWVYADVPRDDIHSMDRLLGPIAKEHKVKPTGGGCALSNTEFWQRDNSFNLDNKNELEIKRFQKACEDGLKAAGFKDVFSKLHTREETA